MKILKRFFFGLLIVLILIFAGVFTFLQVSKPTLNGELTLNGLHENVEVLYDDYGVPHIYANNEHDAYYALGYVHAQDRLFQMEMLRRAAGGRLSEVLGPDLIKVDKLFRTLGINKFASESAQQFLSSDTSAYQKGTVAYQKGINEFIKTGDTPIEFLIMGIPKTEFKPEDIYLAIGFMSFGFAEALQVDPVLEKIKNELGAAYLQDLAVQTPANAELIKNFNGEIKPAGMDSLISAVQQALEYLPVPRFQGSNGWVISGSRTASSSPILANDTHIGFGQPAVWYEAHIEYPGFRFYGHHLAGIPFGLLGNNDKIGWGLTMFENDDMDFFVEELNPENANQVKFKDQWENLSIRNEIIKVKGEEDIVLEIKSSRHGPIVNGGIDNIPAEEKPIAMWWMLTQQPNEAIEAAYRLNHAANFAETQKAVSLFSAPGLNVMYGDVDGNIAWWAVAKLPIRPAHVNSKLFLDGASGNDEYLGFYPFEKNPQSINPPWGYVYSCNNQPDSVDGVLYPGYYYPKSRAGRVNELLAENKKWTTEDMKKVNLDVVGKPQGEVAKTMATILRGLDKPEFDVLFLQLETWNGNHESYNSSPSVYYNLLSQVIFLSMKDELGETAFKTLMETSVPKNSYLSLISNENSPWWDNVLTKEVIETRANIFEQAAIKTLSALTQAGATEDFAMPWGKIHTLTHNHPLGTVKPLDKFFNVGPFEVEGGQEVINNLTFSLDTTGYFPVSVGPALRKITDFSAIENGETILPTGQSGNVMSPHYDDQALMFATGKFRGMLMNRPAIESKSKNRLLLKVK
ncbi:penicillin acylase family protein [Chryseotalea sanaruensis]|uniref:penicillin acylase family protein n=1 Tax=Chryseotalea sanaruensis TaxID=2482724 RepID=UPI000F8ED625|nr:penicillin acylase family protein [Chryseotalea sanaruensis]